MNSKNIEDILNIKFEEKPVPVDNFFTTFNLDLSECDGYFKGLEFRKPNDFKRNNKGLITLLMKLELEINKVDIINNFGMPKFMLPPPNWIKNSMQHLVYNYKNLNMSFGFPHRGDDCLNSIVFDYYTKNI